MWEKMGTALKLELNLKFELKLKATLTGVAIILGLYITPALAQGTADEWQMSCGEGDQISRCSISQDLFLNQKQQDGTIKPVGRILKLTVVYVKDANTGALIRNLALQLPLGVDLRPGAIVRIDASKEISLPFLQCTQAGCDTSMVLDEALTALLKNGKIIQVGFRPWGTAETSVVPATLTGFTKALAGLDASIR